MPRWRTTGQQRDQQQEWGQCGQRMGWFVATGHRVQALSAASFSQMGCISASLTEVGSEVFPNTDRQGVQAAFIGHEAKAGGTMMQAHGC